MMAVAPVDAVSGMSEFPSNSSRFKSTINQRLCNLLSSEKFRRWVIYEWFYCVIDRDIFLGPNDFQLILRTHFPTLTTTKLARSQWSLIRRLIGRPRRFSATFLGDERENLRRRRMGLHYLQHVLSDTQSSFGSQQLESLLSSFPAGTTIHPRLPPGTRVCVRLFRPVRGLFLGVIQESYSTSPNYTVLVESSFFSNSPFHLPSESDDYLHTSQTEFLSVSPEDLYPLHNQKLPESIPLSSLRDRIEPKAQNDASSSSALPYNDFVLSTFGDTNNSPPGYATVSFQPTDTCSTEQLMHHQSADTILTSEFQTCEPMAEYTEPVSDSVLDPQSTMPLYVSLAKLFNLLEQKRFSVETLKEMNDVAEAKLSENEADITLQFQHSYATLILRLDQLNQELQHHMEIVLMHIAMIAQEQDMNVDHITEWRRRCDDEAQEMVSRIKFHQNRANLDGCKVDLVAKLSCLLIHICNLSDQRAAGLSLACIEELLKEIRRYLHPNNLKSFELTVESLIGQIIHSLTSSMTSRWQTDHSMAPEQECYQGNLNCL